MGFDTSTALEMFETFIGYDCSEPFVEQSLADIINYWLWYDRGIAACFGSFRYFQQVIPVIVDTWSRDPQFLDYAGDTEEGTPAFERRVTSAFGSNANAHPIFSEQNFNAATFYWKELGGRDARLRKPN